MEFIDSLLKRNEVLFWFGLVNLIVAIVFFIFSWLKPLEFAGVNAWYKPIKFALSTTILSWSVAWYTGHLTMGKDLVICNWIIVVTLAFEVIYIAWQASRGQASHFNESTPFYSFMFVMMAVAASIATLAVGYIGVKFFSGGFPELPKYYLWAIRFGFVLFVIFSFQGFAMGAQLAHTVGGADGGPGLPFLNWSRVLGDLRVAHFVGMHALQLIPILSYYLLKDVKLTVLLALLYAGLAVVVLVQALQAKPLFGT